MSVKSKRTYEDFVKFLGNKPWKVGFSIFLGNNITPYPIDKIISKNKNEKDN